MVFICLEKNQERTARMSLKGKGYGKRKQA
jgi:hypothetical protein